MHTSISATKTDTFRIGLIGTGRISDIYLHNCAKYDALEIVACGSMDMAESEAKAKIFDIPHIATPDEIIASNNIDCILNLTTPSAHYPIYQSSSSCCRWRRFQILTLIWNGC